MRILQRYILVDFITNFVIALIIFTGFMTLANLRVPLRRGLGLIMAIQFMHLYFPYVLTWSIPLSVLTASVTSFAKLSETGELTAIRSAGIHVVHLLTPIFLGVSLLTVSIFFMNSNLIPFCRRTIHERMQSMYFDFARTKLQSGEKSIDLPPYRIFVGNVIGDELQSLAIRAPLANDETLVLRAKRATFHTDSQKHSGSSQLHLMNGSTMVVQKNEKTSISGTRAIGTLQPKEWTWTKNVLTVGKDSQSRGARKVKDRTLGQIYSKIKGKLLASPQSREEKIYLIEFHKRIALSIASIVFVLIGAPFGMLGGKSTRLFGFVWSLILALGVYYPLLILGNSLAKSAVLPPWFALLFPNALFIFIGLFLCRVLVRV